MQNPEGLVFHLQRFSLQDGPGLRTTVFLKGCPLACAWCHNPESQSAAPELLTLEQRCMHCGSCVETTDADSVEGCPTGARQRVGRSMTASELVTEVLRDRIFFEQSGGGVTFSGGEPLLQATFVSGVAAALQANGIHTALDTCGFAPTEALLQVASHMDLVLYDLKLMDEARHREMTGESNGLILTNLRALGAQHPRIWLRVPIIPGINDDAANLAATAQFAVQTPGIQRVDLLPYHATGVAKFGRLGLHYRLEAVAPPSVEQLDAIAQDFRAQGLNVTIGGRP
ncbi:MAG: glycyl-radical enzyme activating protein [Holophaga sp.]